MSTGTSTGKVSSKNVKLITQSDQGGRPDGVQLMVHRGYAYIAHIFSNGVSVMDVRDPRNPKPVNFLPAFGKNWNIHLQTHEDLLFVIDEFNFYANEAFSKEESYYTQSVEDSIKQAGANVFGQRGVDYSAGFRVYDISKPDQPRQIGQFQIEGLGCHRLWYVGGRYAYVSALLDGYSDHIFMIVDVSDPTRPFEVSRWWLPGQWSAGGEQPTWGKGDRVALHHAIVARDIAYGSWRDGGLTLIDVSDAAKPRLLSHLNLHPPFGGGTHTAVPLTDRVPAAHGGTKDYVMVLDEAIADNCADQVKYIWSVDVRDKTKPVTVATFPTPTEQDYCSLGGHFGPHNLHENRPGSFQSSELMFATYQNAGVRIFNTRDPMRPEEVGYYVPSGDIENWLDTRPNRPRVAHSADVFVDAQGLIYVTDFNAGLHILEYTGA
jgi:hypothetical protein